MRKFLFGLLLLLTTGPLYAQTITQPSPVPNANTWPQTQTFSGGAYVSGSIPTSTGIGTADGSLVINGTNNGSDTALFAGLLSRTSMSPQGATVSSVLGGQFWWDLKNSSANPTNFGGILVQQSVESSFTGTIAPYNSMFEGVTFTNNTANPIAYFDVFRVDSQTNGDGATTGTVKNQGFNCSHTPTYASAFTASSAGATITSSCFYMEVPTGNATAGTNNNYGIWIHGNGGTAAGGTVNNLALYSDSTAPSSLAGALTVSGTLTMATPFTLGATSVTSTGTQLNYLNAATGTTGTASADLVFSASPTFTGTVTSPQLLDSGAVSAAAWTTSGLQLIVAGSTLTDTSSSGTVTNNYNTKINGAVNAASASTTYSNDYTLDIEAPTAGANVSITNAYSLRTGGKVSMQGLLSANAGAGISGGTVSINASSNFTTNIGTGTTTQPINIGNSGTTGVTSLLGLSTGTNADTVCLSAAGVVLIQAAACTISSARFKRDMKRAEFDAIDAINHLNVDTFWYKAKNRDPNGNTQQMGLIAENVARVFPVCAEYEPDMKTPKSYKPECMIALLVKGMQQLAANDNARITKLEAEVAALSKAKH